MGTIRFFSVVLALLLSAPLATASYNNIKDSSRLSWEKLKKMIEHNGLKSVEKTLNLVKDTHPEFFRNYVLMYHSRSLQGSSFENPRAILFDRSGQFIFSFNGNRLQRGFNRLEIMQFQKGENRFEFREVIFSDSGEVTFSGPNPAKCMVCHQDVNRTNIDPRPNWEPYNIWPGAYGSNSGRLYTSKHEKNQPRFQRMDTLMLENMEREKEELEKFFAKTYPEHPRYQLLEAKSYDPDFTTEITQILANLNFRRVSRIITEEWAQVYEYLEPAVWGVAKCGKLLVSEETYQWIQRSWPKPEYWGEETLLSHPPIKTKGEILEDLLSNGFVGTEMDNISQKGLSKAADVMYERQFERQKDYYSIDPTRGLHHLFEPLGISTADWSMDFKTEGRLAFRERLGTPSNTKQTFYKALQEVTGIRVHKMSCKELGKKSEENFARLKSSPLFQELMAQKKENELKKSVPIIRRCVRCHASDDPAIPSIAFDNPEKLKSQLKGPALYSKRNLLDEIRYRLSDYAKESERMPMGPIVSKQQRQDLVEYLEKVVSNTSL